MLKGRDETHGGLVAVKIWGEPVVSGWKTFEIPMCFGGKPALGRPKTTYFTDVRVATTLQPM